MSLRQVTPSPPQLPTSLHRLAKVMYILLAKGRLNFIKNIACYGESYGIMGTEAQHKETKMVIVKKDESYHQKAKYEGPHPTV